MPTVAEVGVSVVVVGIVIISFFVLKETHPLLAIWFATLILTILVLYKLFIASPDEYPEKHENEPLIMTLSVVSFIIMSCIVYLKMARVQDGQQHILRQGIAHHYEMVPQDLFNVPRQDIYGDPDFQNVITFNTIPDGTEVVHITSRPGNNPNDSIYPVPEEEHLRRAFFQNLAKRNIRTRTPFTREHVRRGPFRHRSTPKKK